MRKIILLLAIAITTLCCSKKSDESSNEFAGSTWQLTKTLNDPGNGSGQWQIYTGQPLFLRLLVNGSVQADNGIIPSYLDKYEIVDNTTMLLINSSNGIPSQFTYELTSNKLILRGPCREPCGLEFRRAQK